MTKIERILAAINGGEVDCIPKAEFRLEDGFVKALLGIEDVDHQARIRACELLHLDALAFSARVSEEDKAWTELKQWREQSDFFIFAIVDGPFQGLAKAYPDFTEYLVAVAKNNAGIKEQAAEVSYRSWTLGVEALELGANGIIIADDIAYQHGTYVSPRILRERFFPYLKELVAQFHENRIPVFFHSDGDILQVLEDICAMGFDGIHSIEKMMDKKEVRRLAGNRCLMGGFDLGWFADGKHKAAELLRSELAQGPYIFGSCAGILDGSLPAAKVREVYDYVHEYPVR